MSTQKRAQLFLFLKYGLFSIVFLILGIMLYLWLKSIGVFVGMGSGIIFDRYAWIQRGFIQSVLVCLILSSMGLSIASIVNQSDTTPNALLQSLALLPVGVILAGLYHVIDTNRWLEVPFYAVMLGAFFIGGLVLMVMHHIKQDKPTTKVALMSMLGVVFVLVGCIIFVEPRQQTVHSLLISDGEPQKSLKSMLGDEQLNQIQTSLDSTYIKHWTGGKKWRLSNELLTSHVLHYVHQNGTWSLELNVEFPDNALKCRVLAHRKGSWLRAAGPLEGGKVLCSNDVIKFRTDLSGKLIFASIYHLTPRSVGGLSQFFESSFKNAVKIATTHQPLKQWAGAFDDKSITFAKTAVYKIVSKPNTDNWVSVDIKASKRNLHCVIGHFLDHNKKPAPGLNCIDQQTGEIKRWYKAQVEQGRWLKSGTMSSMWKVEQAKNKLAKTKGLQKLLKMPLYDEIQLLADDAYQISGPSEWNFHRHIAISETQTLQMMLFVIGDKQPLMCAVFVSVKGDLPRFFRMIGSKNRFVPNTTCWSAKKRHQFAKNGRLLKTSNRDESWVKWPLLLPFKKEDIKTRFVKPEPFE